MKKVSRLSSILQVRKIRTFLYKVIQLVDPGTRTGLSVQTAGLLFLYTLFSNQKIIEPRFSSTNIF